MAREFSVIIERDAEGYYIGSVPDLRRCHTQAKPLDVPNQTSVHSDPLSA
jgi:predicted RNase H-like HicB family nuclease